jgi:hypothetical protein
MRGVLIWMPTTRQVVPHTVQSLYDTGQLLASQGVPSRMRWLGMSDLVGLRNLMVSLWYDTHPEASHLLFVDDDMHFSANLVWDMLQFDKPLVGAFYSKREASGVVVGQVLNDTDTIDNVEKGFLKVKGVGAGVLLIKRQVIDKMISRIPDFVDTTGISGAITWAALKRFGGTRLLRPFDLLPGLSEDLSFCKRWRDLGGEVWANVHHPIGHVGPHDFVIRYSEYLEKKKAA